MTTTIETEFKPTAVLITPAAEFQTCGRTAVDPKLAIPLHLDSYCNTGWLYTREEWARVQDEPMFEPRIYRRSNRMYEGLAEGERVELLPDMWIVKCDEREYWVDPRVLELTKRIFCVYVFDRRYAVHICSFQASYELCQLGYQWESSRELTDEETEELDDLIREGSRDDETYHYMDVEIIDRTIKNGCKEGFYPADKSGGYHIDVVSVVTADAIAEIQEAYCQSEL